MVPAGGGSTNRCKTLAALTLLFAGCFQVSETFLPAPFLTASPSGVLSCGRAGKRATLRASAPASTKAASKPSKPVLVKPLRPQPGAGDAGGIPGSATRPHLPSDRALSMFQRADQDKSDSLSYAEFEDLIVSMEPETSPELISSLFQSVVCDEDTCKESISFLGFYRWLNKGSAEADGKSIQQRLVRQNYMYQAQLLFKEADKDGGGSIDAPELKVLGDAMGIKWSKSEAKEVLVSLSKDGKDEINFDEFFEWFCSQTASGRDKTGIFSSQLRLMLRAHGVEQRQLLITGFPFKASEETAKRFFSRCGQVESVKMLPWAKTGKPSGRFMIEFENIEGAQAALQMHRKKMGPRDLGVFRINVGDSEETMPVDKLLHSAILGPQGAFVKTKEAETGARIFVRHNETHGWVTLKGTPKERETARTFIREATQGGVATESITIPIQYKDVLLARKGRALHRLESQSGAKVYVSQTPPQESKSTFGVKKSQVQSATTSILQVTGMREQRMLLKVDLESLILTHTDNVHKVPTKFHGTLKGKNAVVIQRVEQETDTMITFSTEDGGLVSISGDKVNCEKAWSMFEHFKENLPALLNKLRAGVLQGDLECVPFLHGQVDAELVWPLALEEALMKFKKAKRMF